GSTAWFEDCDIHVTANGYITAANTTKAQKYGYVFHRCRVTGEPGVRTFLGRPWRPWSATVWLNTSMSDAGRQEGGDNWNDPAREKTVRYAEYGSTGATRQRVGWAHPLTDAEAKEYTIEKVLGGIDGWNPKTGAVARAIRVTPARVARSGMPSVQGPDGVW